MTTDRADLDSALSYRLTENFKVFAGYKYQYTRMKMEFVDYSVIGNTVSSAQHTNVDLKMPFNGPAAGIGFSMPIGERFFFASNLSVLYMWGTFHFNMTEYYYDLTGPKKSPGPSDTSGVTMQSRGINFEPTIGASMGESLPIITLGVRGQWSQTKFHNSEKINMKEKWANDYQYGLFISIVQPI